MENPWLRRYTVLVAACTALLFINGPVVSTSEERPLYSLGQTHAWLGVAVTILMVGLVIWLSRLKEPVWLRRLAWAALAATVVQGLSALQTGPLPVPVRIAHTVLALLLFSTTMVIAVLHLGKLEPDSEARPGWFARPVSGDDDRRARAAASHPRRHLPSRTHGRAAAHTRRAGGCGFSRPGYGDDSAYRDT